MKEKETNVQKWEYERFFIPLLGSDSVEKRLDEMGKAGWEAFSIREQVRRADAGLWFFLKRPVKESESLSACKGCRHWSKDDGCFKRLAYNAAECFYWEEVCPSSSGWYNIADRQPAHEQWVRVESCGGEVRVQYGLDKWPKGAALWTED